MAGADEKSGLPPGPGKTARNERRKLFASILNTLAGATITVGVLAPAAGILYGFSAPGADRSGLYLLLIGTAWLLAGALLHSMAHLILGGIEE